MHSIRAHHLDLQRLVQRLERLCLPSGACDFRKSHLDYQIQNLLDRLLPLYVTIYSSTNSGISERNEVYSTVRRPALQKLYR